METGFEKLFVRRGHPSDDVIDGELSDEVTWQYCSVPKYPVDFLSISINLF